MSPTLALLSSVTMSLNLRPIALSELMPATFVETSMMTPLESMTTTISAALASNRATGCPASA